jgi:O-methyltransferase involved in polyketide biosynthesis
MGATVPCCARILDYWLGGKDSFPVDRELGDHLREIYPAIIHLVRSRRHFLIRAVSWLAAEAGVRQFLDIGSGLPTAGNTHQAAQWAAPGAKVVYLDNDRQVVRQARELLSSGPEGATAYVEGDFRDPAAILQSAASTLDFARPVAVILVGMLSFFGNDQEDSYVVRQLMHAAAPGSYLAIADTAVASPGLLTAAQQYAAAGAAIYYLRRPQQLERFFDLELVPPGLVPVPRWHPAGPEAPGADDARDRQAGIRVYGGVGRKLFDPDQTEAGCSTS